MIEISGRKYELESYTAGARGFCSVMWKPETVLAEKFYF